MFQVNPDCDLCGGEGVVEGLVIGDRTVAERCLACKRWSAARQAALDLHPVSLGARA